MAFYLVRAETKGKRIAQLRSELDRDAFVEMRPFGRALTKGLEGARADGGAAVWEEEDYCSPPLAEELPSLYD